MIRILLTITLAAGTALAQQTAAPAPAPQSTPAAPATQPRHAQGPDTLPTLQQRPVDNSAKVPAGDPVLTIHGACENFQQNSDPNTCKTVVTKEQFDKLIQIATPNNQPLAPANRRNLGQLYVDLVARAQAAEKAGVDKDPKFQEILKLQRMKLLGDMYLNNYQEQHKNPSDQELQAYYNQNSAKFQEVKLGRIFIPKNNPTGQDNQDFEKKASQIAATIRERAAKGENLETLQKEAYTSLGLTAPPPNTEAGTRRKGMLQPQEEEEIFGLKPGEVSKVEQEPSGFIIYKVESNQVAPLDQVKDQISRELVRENMEAQVKSIQGAVHADFNDQYFGPPTPAPGAGESAPAGPGSPATKPASTSTPPKKPSSPK